MSRRPPVLHLPRLVLVASIALLAAACATTPAPTPSTTTVILVRHAEKVADGSKDPPLTAQGQARAQALATRLHGTPLKAVYSTSYARTRQTAAPAASDHALSVIEYDAKTAAPELAQRLRVEAAGATVLVVGHSNTVPDIAAALCHCEVPAMSEAEYDRLMTVRIATDGSATLEMGRQ